MGSTGLQTIPKLGHKRERVPTLGYLEPVYACVTLQSRWHTTVIGTQNRPGPEKHSNEEPVLCR